MKNTHLLASLAIAALLAAAPTGLSLPFTSTAAQAQEARVSFSVFFDQLRPHGIWVKHAKYKYVFCPKVDAKWRPYTNGRWIFIRDRGWYFDSREPFAWAVYHYGRWVDDDRIGWCWVPGNHWAPAWVSWRRSNDHVGWAPLPPENDGFQINIKVTVGEPPERDWVFVPVRSFLEPDLEVKIIIADRDPEIFRHTEFVGPVIIQNNVVINNVIDIDFIQQQTNQQVTVVEAQSTTDPAGVTTDPGAGTIQVFAPTVDEPKEEEAPPEAVEPEQAQEQLGKPAEGEVPSKEAAPAEGEAAPADQAPAAPATECPEGQQLVEGKCVPAGEQQPAAEQPAAEQPAQPAEATPAEGTAPAEPADQNAAPADQAPAAEPAAPAEETVTCPEGQQLVEGKCLPVKGEQQPAAEQPAEQAAPADEQAAPAEEAAPVEEAASAEEAAPSNQQPPCPEGQQLVKGKCVPIDVEAAPAQ
jgi:hypothetical protein